MKILILDDNFEKLKKITQKLTELEGIEVDDIKTVSNSHDAKIALTEVNFDLFILDLAVPPRVDQEIKLDGGTELLQELIERPKYKVPEHIIGITAYEDVYDISHSFFSNHCRILIYYDDSTNAWSEQLKNGVSQILEARCNSVLNHNYESALCIVSALQEPELAEVLKINWEWEEVSLPNDVTRYHRGSYQDKDGKKKTVIAAAASRMGLVAAAVLTTKMIGYYKPEFVAIIGITAGVPKKTKYGDVIVTETSWDWGSGKWVSESKNILGFLPSPHHIQLSVDLRAKFLKFKEDFLNLAKIKNDWNGEKPDHDLRLLVGPVASGASVIADGKTISQVLLQHRDLLGVEMETYSVFASCAESVTPRPTPFSIKSVVDFGDVRKNDAYQRYGAYTSAQAMRLFVERYL
jgi:nucleoside phosphorylase